VDLKAWFRRNPDRAAAWIVIVLGALALLLGWVGASQTAYTAEQIPYLLSGGLLGALLVALGATLLISADLRDEWRKLDRIERRLAGDDPDAPGVDAATAATNGAAPPTGRPRRRPLVAGEAG
jgi:hypothetical protein